MQAVGKLFWPTPKGQAILLVGRFLVWQHRWHCLDFCSV
jgi:hypothetical protein